MQSFTPLNQVFLVCPPMNLLRFSQKSWAEAGEDLSVNRIKLWWWIQHLSGRVLVEYTDKGIICLVKMWANNEYIHFPLLHWNGKCMYYVLCTFSENFTNNMTCWLPISLVWAIGLCIALMMILNCCCYVRKFNFLLFHVPQVNLSVRSWSDPLVT